MSFSRSQHTRVLLEERDATGGLLANYVYGKDLLSRTTDGVPHYYLYDGFGCVRALSDADEHVTDNYAYDAYGMLLDGSSADANPYRYRGEQYDPELNAYYLRARYYQPGIGRFMTTDPLEGTVYDPRSLHRYLYAHANPVNYIDPSGKISLKGLVIGSGIVLGLAAYEICGVPMWRMLFDENRYVKREREGLENIRKHEVEFEKAAEDHNMDVALLKAIYLNEYTYAKKGSTGTGLRESIWSLGPFSTGGAGYDVRKWQLKWPWHGSFGHFNLGIFESEMHGLGEGWFRFRFLSSLSFGEASSAAAHFLWWIACDYLPRFNVSPDALYIGTVYNSGEVYGPDPTRPSNTPPGSFNEAGERVRNFIHMHFPPKSEWLVNCEEPLHCGF